MTTTKVTRVSWFDRLKNSVLGIGAGIVLIIGMIALLWWNEGRAVQTQRSLSEGSGLVVSLPISSVDPAQEGQLVHLTGALSTDQMLSDDTFLVTAQGVRLVRNVEMYQWIETSTTERQQNLGGSETRTTTYSYALGWADRQQDSSKFQDAAAHQNPPMSHTGSTFRLESAELGAFTVGRNVLDRVGGADRLELPAEFEEPLRERFGENVSIVDGAVYLGADPAQPALGDHRVSYEMVPLGTISVVGAQQGSASLPTPPARAIPCCWCARVPQRRRRCSMPPPAPQRHDLRARRWPHAADHGLLHAPSRYPCWPAYCRSWAAWLNGHRPGSGCVRGRHRDPHHRRRVVSVPAARFRHRLRHRRGLIFVIRQQIVRRRQKPTAETAAETSADTALA